MPTQTQKMAAQDRNLLFPQTLSTEVITVSTNEKILTSSDNSP